MQPDDNSPRPADVPSDNTVNQPEAPAAAPVEQAYSDDDSRPVAARVTYAAGFTPETTTEPTAETDSDYDNEEAASSELRDVAWQAKEYIAPEKNTIWYVCLGLVVVAVVLLDLFYVRSYTLTALIIAIAVVLIVMSVRPARIIDYRLANEGLYIGETLIDLNEYKAFGVIHDGKENSLFLIPIKRFRPGLSVYFPVESGESIVDNLGQRLPMQEIRMDFIDNIVRMLRL